MKILLNQTSFMIVLMKKIFILVENNIECTDVIDFTRRFFEVLYAFYFLVKLRIPAWLKQG